jgi:subtilisin-like proprotein convertase family protein
VDKTHASWQKNGAGFWFSPYYGFGLINAGKAVAMAQKQKPLPEERVLRKTKKTLQIAIPDNDDSGISVPLDVVEDMVIEYVEVTVKTDHSYSGDLRIVLHSPSGTSSILAYGRTLTDDYYLPWTFASLQFYGESAEGKWELSVADLTAKNSGKLDEVTLTLYGHKR